MGILDDLLGGGQRRQDYTDFVHRYDQGHPSEGYSDQEVMDRYRDVAHAVPRDEYAQAAQEAAPRPKGVVDLEEFDSTLYFLEEREINTIASELAEEYRRDVRDAFGGRNLQTAAHRLQLGRAGIKQFAAQRRAEQ